MFGFNLNGYDALFSEKLELLLAIRANKAVTWSGRFRAPLRNQPIYPRPLQKQLPIWLGVGGTPASFVRAGTLGLPLMVAVIGGETHRFRPLVDLYRKAGAEAGHSPDQLSVGLHSFGYVAKTREEAIETFYPGYEKVMNKIGRERGWPPTQRANFMSQIGQTGSIVLGSPQEVADKLRRHSEALGGISRFTFQMDLGLTHQQAMDGLELIGRELVPLV